MKYQIMIASTEIKERTTLTGVPLRGPKYNGTVLCRKPIQTLTELEVSVKDVAKTRR